MSRCEHYSVVYQVGPIRLEATAPSSSEVITLLDRLRSDEVVVRSRRAVGGVSHVGVDEDGEGSGD
jgi:hypothetical protein